MTLKQKPKWLKMEMPGTGYYPEIKRLLQENNLNTVCSSAKCPNIGDCWSRRTATFMILGTRCSRNCRFCAIEHSRPDPPDAEEPLRVAQTVQRLNLRYAVVTSVTRDDLPDGGAGHFSATILAIRRLNPQCRIEVLIPDLQGDTQSLDLLLAACPDVLNHNLETVQRLYCTVRPQADFNRSLKVLHYASRKGFVTKSGMMLGLGESESEVLEAAEALRSAGCCILTLGQYLAPSKEHLPVVRYLPPEEFAQLRQQCLRLGFDHVQAGPMVRSSYHAAEQTINHSASAY